MSHWLPPASPSTAAVDFVADPRTERRLRQIDVLLSLAALAAVGVPLALTRLFCPIEIRTQTGAHGREVQRLYLTLPDGRTGWVLARLGARHWPQLLNILRGDLAWVGPTWLENSPVRDIPAAAGVRPGVVSLWSIRRRTAVDFGTQAEADLEYLAHRGVRHDLGVLLRGAIVALLPLPRHARDGRVRIGDVAFDNVTMPEAVAQLRDMLDGQVPCQVSFVNPACVNIAARDRGYRRALARAALVLPDGIGTKIASDLLGTPLRQNVNGTDLFPRLCDMLDARGASLFLLGGQDGVPQAVAHAVQTRWPNLRVAGLRHGFFTPAEEGDVVRQVRDSGADVLLVARGVPMQDLFIDRHLPFFGVKFAMGVGGLFDFVSGRINRAPRWMRDCGLEWVYRLMQEPGRMWQRYLVGNITFLGRVTLQRLGWRRGADDLQNPAALPAAGRSAPAPSSGVRAVVFATDTVGADLPALPDLPAALLPLGHASFLERCMETLAQASIVDVDLVVSHRPEAMRQQIGNGQRWGLRVRWHLVRDAEHPCEVLRLIPVEGLHRLVIGHASQWIEPAAMQQLANHERTAMTRGLVGSPDEAPRWAGWATVAPARLQQLGPHTSRDDLHRLVMPLGESLDSAHWLWLDERQYAQADSAAALLQAQRTAVGPDNRYEVPASWISTAWGGMSPSARLHPTARLEGPVLIGPGCFVGEGASIGPHVVLTRDVVVSAGTMVRDSVVLPETLLGSGLDFSGTVVTGNRITHLALGVKSVLPPSDGLLLDLSRSAQGVRVSLGSRGLAGLGLVLLAPVLLPDLLLRRISGAAPRWQASAVITGRDDASGQWAQAWLRCPQQVSGSDHGLAALLALGGPLMDVLQGRRAWFGMRPRDAQTWQQLNPDWQDLLAQTPVGVFHAPAWRGDPASQVEAEAAADAFQAVEHGAAANLRTVMAIVDRRWRPTQPVTTPQPAQETTDA